MRFPLDLRFKIMAVSPQVSITDAAGQLVFYVKQKAFKLKEAVTVFADREQTRPLYTIAADRVLDWSASYHFTAAGTGEALGGVRRKGGRSLWRAHYEVFRGGDVVAEIREANPWTKVFDALLGDVPVLGLFTGYLFHPAYVVQRMTGEPLLRLEKQAAFMEGKYKLEQMEELGEADRTIVVLSTIMLLLLERSRG